MSRWLSILPIFLAGIVVVEGMMLADARERIVALEGRGAPAVIAPPARVMHDDEAAPEREDRAARPVPLAPAVRAGRVDASAVSPVVGTVGTADVEGAAPPEQVQRLVRAEVQRMDDEREAGRDQRRRTRVQERAESFAADNALTPEQQTTLTSVLVAEQEEIRQTFREARDNDSFEGVRAKVTEIRTHSDDNMKAVLDPKQMESFAKMRAEDGDRLRGFGGGGSSRPDPPPP